MLGTHTLKPPLLCQPRQQKHGIVSHVSASSCAMGAMWGTHPAKWLGGGGHGCGVEGWCLGTFSLSLSFTHLLALLCMKEAICPSELSMAVRESVTLCTLSLSDTHPPP